MNVGVPEYTETELGNKVTVDARSIVVVGAATALSDATGIVSTVPLGNVRVWFQTGQRSRHSAVFERFRMSSRLYNVENSGVK